MPKCFVDFDGFVDVVDDTEFDAVVDPFVFSVDAVLGFWLVDEDEEELFVVGVDVLVDVDDWLHNFGVFNSNTYAQISFLSLFSSIILNVVLI